MPDEGGSGGTGAKQAPKCDPQVAQTLANAAEILMQQTLPDVNSEEYKSLYLPIMMSVYTARHGQHPPAEEALHEHVFGSDQNTACELCKRETEILVSHQREFF